MVSFYQLIIDCSENKAQKERCEPERFAYSLLEGTGLTCVMKNRYQLTPSRDIYDGCIYSIEGERVTSFSHYTWSMPCIIPFPNDEKCPVSQAGNKAYALP
jgi:hypothetical protein